MNNFKFGDMVRSKVDPLKNKGVIVGDGTNEHMKNVWWDCAEGSLHGEENSSLELIPHPDTIRLSHLAEKELDELDATLDLFDGITVEGGVCTDNDEGCEGGACKI